MDFGIVDISGQVMTTYLIIDWKRTLGLGSSLATHINKVFKDRDSDMSVKTREVIGLITWKNLPINAWALEG